MTDRPSLNEIPRADRGSIWARGEELQRIISELSADTAMMMAMREYLDRIEAGGTTVENRLVDAVINQPHTLFK